MLQVSRDFRGSVFVEFKSPEDMETALAAAMEYEGAPLRLEKKQDYLIRKIMDRKAKGKGQVSNSGVGRSSGSFGVDSNSWGRELSSSARTTYKPP